MLPCYQRHGDGKDFHLAAAQQVFVRILLLLAEEAEINPDRRAQSQHRGEQCVIVPRELHDFLGHGSGLFVVHGDGTVFLNFAMKSEPIWIRPLIAN